MTPPELWWNDGENVAPWRKAVARIQRELWERYVGLAEQIGPIDVVIPLGDMIEGRGSKNNGAELITPLLDEQIDIAETVLRVWHTKSYTIVRGTGYHVAPDGEDLEDRLAQSLQANIYDHVALDFEGFIFDARHHVGSSSRPHTRGTALAGEWVNNVLRASRNEAPLANIIVRAHTHYYSYVGGAGWCAMSLPALQAAQSKYGVRVAGGVIDWGVIEFYVEEERFRWNEHIVRIEANKLQVVKI